MSYTFLNYPHKLERRMNSDAHDCCYCAGKMREGRYDFMARVGDEIRKEFLAGRLQTKPLAAGEIVFGPQRADSIA
jgi:hypothetical protein